MPTLPKNKEQLGIYLSKSVVKELKEFVKSRNGNMYGLSLEVEKAIEDHLQKYRNKNYKFSNKKLHDNKVWQVKRQIREYLSKKHKISLDDLGPISHSNLQEAIKVIKGSDKRTVQKYINLLKEFECITIISTNEYDIS